MGADAGVSGPFLGVGLLASSLDLGAGEGRGGSLFFLLLFEEEEEEQEKEVSFFFHQAKGGEKKRKTAAAAARSSFSERPFEADSRPFRAH